MPELTNPPTRSLYSAEDRERGLLELALCGGSPTLASRRLASVGLEIPKGTLYNWAERDYPHRYEQIREEVYPQIAARVAASAEEVALAATEVEKQMYERMDGKADQIPVRELPSAIRNITTSKALQFDKLSNPIRGRPNVRVERQDVSELWRRLERLVPQIVEGQARELSAHAEGNGQQQHTEAGQLHGDTQDSKARDDGPAQPT
jgi:hypothetical protein